MSKREPKFVKEFSAERPSSKLLKRKRDDYQSPVPTKDRYENIDDYIKTYRALVLEEYKEETAAKDKLKSVMKLEFKISFEKVSNGGEYRVWSIIIPVRSEQVDFESTNSYTLITPTDEVEIKWDPENNPEDLDIEFCRMKGKILRIRENKVYVSFELPKRFWPPDVPNPDVNDGRRPEKIDYTVRFVPSSVIYMRRMMALEALRQYQDTSFIKRIVLGDIPQQRTTGEFKGDLSGLQLTPTQEKIAKDSSMRAFSVIQGPPGCGKTHVIGAIATACLQQNPKERILICGTTNTSVENLIRVIGKDVSSIGKKMVWLAARSKDYDHEDDLTEEQTYLMYHAMINRDTKEGKEYGEIQRKSWEEELSAKELRISDELREVLERQISKEANVVIATLESSAKKCLEDLRFETVILDEATQAIEPSTLIPLIHGAKRWILVGDQKQLGPVVPRADIFKRCRYDVSFFERVTNALHFNYDFLDSQFRMHPLISHFSNRNFYANRIKDMVTEADRMLQTNVFPNNIVFINVDGDEESKGSSFINRKEAEVVMSIIGDMLRGGTKEEEIGVISPYSSQARHIRNEIILGRGSRLKVSTVDSFQGSQREYIIISAVRTNTHSIGFLKDYRRLNVSITRARRGLIIVGNEKALSNDLIWGDFIFFCKQFKNSFFNGGIPIINPVTNQKNKKGPIDPSLFYKRSPQAKKFRIERPTNQMENFVLKVHGKTVILDESTPVKMFSAHYAKDLKTIRSSIANAEARLLWPDSQEDMDFLKLWVQEKVDKLNRGRNVTIAYDSESVCFQFGEVFPDSFDLFKWKEGNVIPQIIPNGSIIVFFYNKSDDKINNNVPCSILKPLLEHPKMTLLTFDFTLDIEVLYLFGINVNLKRMIDCQLLANVDKNDNEDLIATTNNRSLAMSIKKMVNKDGMAFTAKKEMNEGEKDFPHAANKYLILHNDIPATAVISTEFLGYSANDVFLTALMAVETMAKNKLDDVIELTRKKVDQFNKLYNKYNKVKIFREAEYCRMNITVITQGSIDDTSRIDFLINKWDEISKFKKVIDAEIPEIDDKLRLDQKTKDIVMKKFEKIESVLKLPENTRRIKMIALLANPKGDKDGDDDDDDDDGQDGLDDFF